MTKTKTAPKPIVAGAGYKQLFSGDIDLKNIKVESNFRKHFDEKRIKELAENIGKVGVLQPVILRQVGEGFPKPATEGKFILVAGERRFRACQAAGLKSIPGRVLELTPEQALEVQALENLQRRDLTPLEEARAFKALLDAKGHTLEQVQELADRVDKSVNYVYRAVRLLELPKNVQDKIEDGNLTPAHGHQLLRLSAEKLEDAIEWLTDGGNMGGDANPSALALKEYIEEEERDLKKATFPTDETYAGCQACNTCSKNTTNQSSLFDGAEKGGCLDPECFDLKAAQSRKDQVETMLKTFPDGVKNLSTRTKDWNGNIKGLTDAKILDDKAVNKAIRKLMDTNPKAFGVAMVQPQYGSEAPKLTVVCLDRTVLGEKSPEKPKESSYNHEREQFINKAVEKALLQESWNKKPVATNSELLRMVISNMISTGSYDLDGNMEEFLGVKAIQKHVAGADESELPGLMVLTIIMDDNGNDKDKAYKFLGVDVKGITKIAKAEALKAYEAQKKAKPAGAKK